MLKKSYIAAAATGLSAFPLVVLAQPQGAGPRNAQDVINLVAQIATWFETIIFSIAIIMLLVAAFQFLTAAGNEEKVATARKSLVWGLVGIAVALFARVAREFVGNAIERR